MSDHKGARLVPKALPSASTLIADRRYDSAWFREALTAGGITPCIPSSRSRKVPFPYNKARYRQRHKVENLFAKLKDWRRVATGYDRCAHTFVSGICIAATVAFYLNQ
jgi:transposase